MPSKLATGHRSQVLGQTVTTKAVVPSSARPIADLVASLIEPVGEKQRYVSKALVEAWPEIVGERLAGACIPTRMKPQRAARSRSSKEVTGDVLEVVADPAVAVDLEYGQDVLVERLNTYFGYAAISRLKIVRRALGGEPSPTALTNAIHPRQTDREAADTATAGVDSANLREALSSLGSHVYAAHRGRS